MGSTRTERDAELLRAFRDRVRAQIAHALDEEDAQAEQLRTRVLPRLQEALAEARRTSLAGRVWLFGSYAWGQPSPQSDVDLLVEACPDPDRLAALVARHTGTEVHVVPLEHAPASLRTRACEEGVST